MAMWQKENSYKCELCLKEHGTEENMDCISLNFSDPENNFREGEIFHFCPEPKNNNVSCAEIFGLIHGIKIENRRKKNG